MRYKSVILVAALYLILRVRIQAIVSGDQPRLKVTHTKDAGDDGVRTTSSNLYGEIQQYVTYKCTYYGWRFGWASQYPNILKVKVVSTNIARGRRVCLNSANG